MCKNFIKHENQKNIFCRDEYINKLQYFKVAVQSIRRESDRLLIPPLHVRADRLFAFL